MYVYIYICIVAYIQHIDVRFTKHTAYARYTVSYVCIYVYVCVYIYLYIVSLCKKAYMCTYIYIHVNMRLIDILIRAYL